MLMAVLELLCLLLTTVRSTARPQRDLVLENLLLRHQLAVLTRPTRTRRYARLRLWDKLLWIVARRFCAGWREHLSFVTPDTVVRWHRQGWRLFWRWKSRSHGGRPHLSPEVRDLIASISRDNRLWGTERIRGELLKLGIVVSNRTIRRYRWRRVRPGDSQLWRTFLVNQLRGIWAADLFVVRTVSFRILICLLPDSPRAAGAAPLQCHGQSDCCLDLAAAPGGNALGPTACSPPSRPRRRLRR